MAFEVETGSGSSTANAQFSVEFADSYFADRGIVDWCDATLDAKQPAIVRASAYMTSYNWKGYKRNGRTQTMAWPRQDVVDENGFGIHVDEIPIEVKQGGSELALRELAQPGYLTPDVVLSDQVQSEQIGDLSVTYNIQNSAVAYRPT